MTPTVSGGPARFIVASGHKREDGLWNVRFEPTPGTLTPGFTVVTDDPPRPGAVVGVTLWTEELA